MKPGTFLYSVDLSIVLLMLDFTKADFTTTREKCICLMPVLCEERNELLCFFLSQKMSVPPRSITRRCPEGVFTRGPPPCCCQRCYGERTYPSPSPAGKPWFSRCRSKENMCQGTSWRDLPPREDPLQTLPWESAVIWLRAFSSRSSDGCDDALEALKSTS